jgi:hypothetical protein
VAKLMWQVKLVAELQPGVTTETEIARIERDEEANLAELGLRLEEAKQLTAALQAQMVPAQVAMLGECCRSCETCGSVLASKGHYPVRFRSLFGDVPLRVRRLLICPCQGGEEAKSTAVLGFGGSAVAPELTYLTARYAALAPFGQVAALLSELLPMSGTQHASTVRNRTRRVGETVVPQHSADTAKPAGPVVIGLDGGYVRNRHAGEGRHFAVIAGKVIDAEGSQHRFAPVQGRQPMRSSRRWLRQGWMRTRRRRYCAMAMPGCGGCSVRRCPMPRWCWTGGTSRCVSHTRCRPPAALAPAPPRTISPIKPFAAWSGPSGACGPGCRRKLAALCRWTQRQPLRDVVGIGCFQRHISDLLGYLERNQDALVHYAARRRRGEPISTAFVESAVNEIVARRMNKKQQMRWNRMTVQPFLDVRTAVLNGTLEKAF